MRIVFGLEPRRGGRSFRFEVVAARDRLAAPPFGEISVGALRAGVHRGRVDRANEPLRQFALRRRSSCLHDDLARDVAPVENGQARHERFLLLRRALEKCADPVEAGEAALIGEAEPFGGRLGLRSPNRDRRTARDGRAAGNCRSNRRAAQESGRGRGPDDQRVEMAREKIGEVERARLLFHEAREGLLAGVERVAMRALDALHAFFGEHAIEFAAGSAIAVKAEDLVVGAAIGADLRPHRLRDSLGAVVQAAPAGRRHRCARA